MKFAKLFENEEIGQVLVKMGETEDGRPEIKTYFVPEGLGVSSMSLEFQDGAWDAADAAFEAVDEEKTLAAVRNVIAELERAYPPTTGE